jgi:uncharacterized protein (TIGR03437 family)
MRTLPLGLLFASGVCAVWAQTKPVVLPRGIVNAFTQLPAPALVGRGGIVQINGLNLGPPGGLKATDKKLPAQLGDVQVLINGKPAPLYSVDVGTIIAQVPVDATPGTAELIVQRAAGSSPPAHFIIQPVDPSIRTADGSGFGMPWGTISGRTVTLSGSGLGPTDPVLESGVASAATPTAPIDAFIGGMRTTATAAASTTRVGEFDIQVDVPTGAQQGDLISIVVGNRSANPTTFQTMNSPTVRAVPIPDGSPDFTSIADTDLNGNFLIATSARDANGCYSGVVFDLLRRTSTPIPDCLTTAARDPIIAPPNSNVLGALIGPPQGTPPAPISATLALYGPNLDAPLSVSLPSAVAAVAPAAGGNLCALVPGTPPQTVLINGQTGEVTNQPCGATAALGAAGGGGIIPNLNIDGLTAQLSPAAPLGQGRSAVLVADNADRPTKVEFAIVNQGGNKVLSKPFPDGWQPLFTPAALQPPNGAPGPVAPVARFRTVAFIHPSGPSYYTLVNNSDNSKQAMVSFPFTQADPALVPFPDGWFVAGCLPNIAVFDIQLSSSKVLPASRDATLATKTACNADGFLQLNLDSQSITATALPSQAQVDVRAMSVLNDYVYGFNPTAARAATDTVFTFDGATGSLLTPQGPPNSISGFATPLQQVPDLNLLLSEATNRTAGDAGLILIDLDNQVTTLLPLPDGFDSVSAQGIYLATRKVVGIGVRSGGRGSQFIMYDLSSDSVTVVPNPPGIAFVGARPGANRPGGPGAPGAPAGPGAGPGAALAQRGLISANASANTISAVGVDPQGKQAVIMVVRIP